MTDPFSPYIQQSDNGSNVYVAGYPNYTANFTRDTLKAGIISGRADLLESQLEVSAHFQGVEDNHLTGERPGKIHHEMPGAQLEGRGDGYTTYNACDTTALFLIGAEGLSHLDRPAFEKFLSGRRSSLQRAVDHVLSLVGEDNLYWDKTTSGSDGYTLRVTYWKDSILPHANGKLEPAYPVTFSQAHFIAARGVLSASRVLDLPGLTDKADLMLRAGIREFMQTNDYIIYKDREGDFAQASSDELHSLAYIPAKYADLLPLDAMRHRAEILATPYGYICTPASIAEQLTDMYHADKIWPFEQANIHYGASKVGLTSEANTAATIAKHIGKGQEVFGIRYSEDGSSSLIPEGDDRQLWSVAAAEYFTGNSLLSKEAWL
ncbi:MAG TPA: hypothetical protein VMR34_03480 [Candidatus Saccharimonadales bacterium]|nr:hypothetical protein [Candidatus Saccharimonadales bacterium]